MATGRSPMRVATDPPTGDVIENDSGRTSITSDVVDTEKANTDWSRSGARMKPPMYAAPEKREASSEAVKFRRRKNSSGSSGNATRDST